MPEPDPEPAIPDQPGSAPSRPDRRWWLVAVAVGIPILVLVVALAQRTWYPTGDQAQAELRMRSLPWHPPLVGAAGRIQDEAGRQGNHPGPLMFWATWPLYALLGRSAWAFEAATALVNLAWVGLSVWLVRRRAGLAACAWFGVVTLVLIGGYGLDALSQPWNPWVALAPFMVLVLAAWGALAGERWSVVLAVAAASYSLQSHVGYAPVALPLVAVAAAAPLWRWWQDRRLAGADGGANRSPGPDAPRSPNDVSSGDETMAVPPGRRSWAWWAIPVAVAAVVGVALWSGPFLDWATHHPSNVDKLAANFGHPSDPPIGLRRAAEAVLQSSAPLGAWVWGGVAVEGSILPGLALLVAWASVAAAVAWRRLDAQLTRLNALVALELALGVFAVSRIFGSLYLYVFRWIVPLVALVVFTLGWGLAKLVPAPGEGARRRLAGVAVVVLVAGSAVMSVRLARQDIPYGQSGRAERALAPAVAAKLDRSKTYLIRWDDPAYLGGIGFGLVLDLERRGFDVGADPRFDAAVEPRRVLCPGQADAVVTVVTGPHTIAAYDHLAGYRRIAYADPRASAAAYDRTFARLLTAWRAAGHQGDDADALERKLNLIVLDPAQPRPILDLAADLVLGGVPSAAYLQDPAPPEPPVARNALNEPCWKDR
jgi:hypothetical protein